MEIHGPHCVTAASPVSVTPPAGRSSSRRTALFWLDGQELGDEHLRPADNRRHWEVAALFHMRDAFRPVGPRARERNRTAAYRRERRRRHTVVEGIFASLDRLGWEKARLRVLWQVDCAGYTAALAHNVLKMARSRYGSESWATHGRCDGPSRRAATALCAGGREDSPPHARTTMDPPPVGHLLSVPDAEH